MVLDATPNETVIGVIIIIIETILMAYLHYDGIKGQLRIRKLKKEIHSIKEGDKHTI